LSTSSRARESYRVSRSTQDCRCARPAAVGRQNRNVCKIIGMRLAVNAQAADRGAAGMSTHDMSRSGVV
jgi:hypothetical protein